MIGWRKTHADAATFYFTALGDSYAARTGRPDNVGVIGAAVFRERGMPSLAPVNVFPGETPAVRARARQRCRCRRQRPTAARW